MDLRLITPLLITRNEEANLERTLAALGWAQRIVVVDSHSDDATRALLDADPRVECFTRAFDDFASQCAFGQGQVRTPYTLSLDADHVVSDELVAELRALDPDAADAWTAPFVYCIDGKPLRASLLPPRIVLFRTANGRYVTDGHAHRVAVEGGVRALRNPIRHDDRKPLERWLEAQARYAADEAHKLRTTPLRRLGWADRLRRFHLAWLLVLPYCLLVKGLVFEGRRGWFYAAQRLYFELLLTLVLARRALGRRR